MDRYVASSQRSGLNWLRFCIESFYGQRTPGQRSVLSKDDCPQLVFKRSHDALNLSSRSRRSEGGSWTKFDPQQTGGSKVLLLVRDPLEAFVRMSNSRYPKFASYVSNIKFYQQAVAADRMVAYYEDIVGSPASMFETMRFLEIEPAQGYDHPTLEDVENRWQDLGRLSRANYDAKQSGTGGAHTKNNPTDFQFHQRKLDKTETERVWRYLNSRLTSEELTILDRYKPDGEIQGLNLRDHIRFWRA